MFSISPTCRYGRLFPLLNENLTDSKYTKYPHKQTAMYWYKEVRNDFNNESYQYLSTHHMSALFLNYEDGIQYVDSAHYSPRTYCLIAENIFKLK